MTIYNYTKLDVVARAYIRSPNYKRKYLSRRIPYASNGSFNPYIITNKEAHLVNGNPALSKDSNSRKSSQTKPHLQERFGKEISQSLPRSFLPVELNAFQELLP